MSNKKQAPEKRDVFESVVDAYFHFTMKEEDMTMQQAIRLACDATSRTYNSSMYTRWREKSPQQDVLKFMQHYVAKIIIKQSFPDINDKKLTILVNNLSVPVSDDQNMNIANYFAKSAA